MYYIANIVHLQSSSCSKKAENFKKNESLYSSGSLTPRFRYVGGTTGLALSSFDGRTEMVSENQRDCSHSMCVDC